MQSAGIYAHNPAHVKIPTRTHTYVDMCTCRVCDLDRQTHTHVLKLIPTHMCFYTYKDMNICTIIDFERKAETA